MGFLSPSSGACTGNLAGAEPLSPANMGEVYMLSGVGRVSLRLRTKSGGGEVEGRREKGGNEVMEIRASERATPARPPRPLVDRGRHACHAKRGESSRRPFLWCARCLQALDFYSQRQEHIGTATGNQARERTPERRPATPVPRYLGVVHDGWSLKDLSPAPDEGLEAYSNKVTLVLPCRMRDR